MKSLKHGFKWSSLNAVGLITSKLLRGIIIPKILEPTSYALFTSISVYTRYLQFADMGSSAYFIKKLPDYYFNQSSEACKNFINVNFTLIILSFVLSTIYLGVVTFFYHGEMTSFYKTAFLLLIPVTIISKIKDLYIFYSFGTQQYKEGNKSTILNNYMSLICVSLGLFLKGAIGGVIGMLFSECILLLYVMKSIPLRMKLIFNKKIFSEWKFIIKQFLVLITELFVTTIDQLFLLANFDLMYVGLYSLGLTFSWILEAISEIFNSASYPKLMAMVKNRRNESIALINQTLLFYLLSSLLILPIVIYFIELIVKYYFIRYVEGLHVYSLMLLLGVIRGGISLLRRGYIALDKEYQYVTLILIITVIYVPCLLLTSYFSFSFDEVILTIIFINCIFFLILYVFLVEKFTRAHWKNLLLIFTCFISLSVYQYIFNVDSQGIVNTFSNILFLFFLFSASSVFMFSERKLFAEYLRH